VRRGDVLALLVVVAATGAIPGVPPAIVVVPSNAVAVSLPSTCVALPGGSVSCNFTSTSASLSLSLVVPLGAAAATVGTAVHIAAFSGGAYTNVTAATMSSLSTVFATRTLASLAVTATAPAMNALTYGGTVTVAGSNLDLLPSRLFVGPVVVETAIAAGLGAATFSLASAGFAASGASVRAAMAAYEADAKRRLFAAACLSAAGEAAIALVRGAVSSGSTVPLHRFNANFTTGEIFLNPEVAAAGATVTIGTSAVTVPAPPAAAISNAAGTTTTALFSSLASGLSAPTTSTLSSANLAAAPADGTTATTAVSTGGSWSDVTFGGTPQLALTVSDAAPVGLVTQAAGFNATISAANARTHTNYTVSSRYVVPAFATRVTLAAGYKATVALELAGTTAVTAVAVLMYTDRVSRVGFKIRSSSTGCAFTVSNQSTECRTAALAAASRRSAVPWSIALAAAAPSYFRRDIVARLHITSGNAKAVELRVRLQHTVDVGVTVFFDPAGTVDAVVDPAVAATATTPPPAKQALGNDAASRGVFSLDGGCAIPKLPIVFIIIACAAVLLGAHWIHQFATRKKLVDAVKTVDVGTVIGLLPQHAYVGAFYPCHRRCGPTHTAQLLVHALCITAVAAALMLSYHALALADLAVAVTFGVFAALIAAVLRPVTGAAFNLFAVDDQRARNTHRGERYRPLDAGLHKAGVRRNQEVGLSGDTMAAFRATTFGYEDEVLQFTAVAAAGEGALRVPEVGVTILTRRYANAGFAICGALSLALAAATLVMTAPWCGDRIAAFERLLLCAFAADVAVVQPLAVLFLWLWRWTISEEADGRAVHDLHPIDGQWRVVGFYDDEIANDDEQGEAVGAVKALSNLSMFSAAGDAAVPALHGMCKAPEGKPFLQHTDDLLRGTLSAQCADAFGAAERDGDMLFGDGGFFGVDQAVIDAAAASTTDGESSMDSQAFEDALNDDDVDGL
jgi:hypothetical protein